MKGVVTTLFVVLVTLLSSCVSTSGSMALKKQEAIDYVVEIVLGSEFGVSDKTVKKWQSDINVFVMGEDHPELVRELDRIIAELNELIDAITIARVATYEESNLMVYLGRGQDYARYEPAAKDHVGASAGLFWVYWNNADVIQRGSIYVDTERILTLSGKKHTLREELTQAMGMMNDSYSYSDSIFYQPPTRTIEYSVLDRFVIQSLYNENMSAGSTRSELKALLSEKSCEICTP